MIEIKDIQGKVRCSVKISPGAKGKFSLMKEDYITLPFYTTSPTDFQVGDYVDLRGIFDTSVGGKLAKIYQIVDMVYPTYKDGKYSYELRLDAYYWKWKTKIFKFTPEVGGQEASWNLTASLDAQLGVLLRNLKALGYMYEGKDFKYSIDNTVENSARLMSYDNINLLDALFEMAKKWDCDCWITDHVINFGRCEFSDAMKVELDKEASDMSRSESKGTYATRIYAFGSTRNIPSNYRHADTTMVVGGIVERRLMLPDGIGSVDAYDGLTDIEAIEAVVVFDDIYPHRVGTIGDVTSYESEVDNEDGTKTKTKFYQFKDSGINFSKEYILAGNELKIRFQSGKLNGMEFGAMFNPLGLTEKNDDGTFNPDAQLWEIVLNENYGRPLPDEILCPIEGDTYVLSGWNAEKITELGLVSAAEQELLTTAKKYVAKSCIDDGTYTTTLNSVWVYEDQINRSFDIGQKINLINPAYFKDGRVSRVIGFEIKLDKPYDSPQYTVGESAAYSRISDVEAKVEELTFKGQTYTGTGGSNIYVIKTNDSTAASNFNVFSALRTLAMFLRKDVSDEAKELTTFLKGLLIGKNGSGFTSLLDGTSQLVVDRLYVKIKAVFDELEVKKKTHIGGEQVISPAGMKCIKVEELASAYRCYFKAEEDGIKIENLFTIGQLAMSQECNIKTGISQHAGNRFYWRTVTVVGTDYIEISKTDCATNSDIPAAGDDIIGFGHKTDISRQGAIVMSSTNEAAPAIVMYQGINSFAYAGKEIISLDFDKATGKARMKVYGDTYIGAKDQSSYMRYTTQDGVEIKGKFVSSITGKNLDNELSNIISDIEAVRTQTDKIVTIWFEEYIPTLTNEPAVNWTTEADRVTHEQDLFFNTLKDPASGGGRAYRWELANGVYGWKEVTDKDTIAALEAATEAQKIAKGKRRIFIAQPAIEDEYDAGDMWVNATYGALYDNDSLVAIIAKAKGVAFNISHWRPSTKITSSYIKQMEDKIEAAVLVTASDSQGNVMSTNKNGLVLTKDFSSLMSTYAGPAGIIKKAEITTFISDKNGEFTSNAVIKADKIDFIGKTMINGKFVVDTNGKVTMTDFTANNGVFNGTVNAIAGKFENVSVKNINSPSDPFYINSQGNLYGSNSYFTNAQFSGTIQANYATFAYGTFQQGTFENITLKKSINTTSDNLYIDAFGAVTVKGKVTATSGSFENVTVKNINTLADPFYIDNLGKFHGREVTVESGTFTGKVTSTDGNIAGWRINVNNISKNNTVLGADGSIYNATGAWYLGNDKTGYLANGNITWDAQGNVVMNNITANGTINASYGSIGGFDIGDGRIGINNGAEGAVDGMFLYNSFIGFNGAGRQAIVGTFDILGLDMLGKFTDTQVSSTDKYGITIDVRNGYGGRNSAVHLGGGYISGFAVKPETVSFSKTITRDVNAAICINNAEITVTLPLCYEYDNGKVVWIKNMNGNRVNIKPPSNEQPINYGQGQVGTTTSPDGLSAAGDAAAYMFVWGLKRSSSSTDTGMWLQFKNPRDW